MEPISRAWIAEFITTFCLIFIGAGAVVMAANDLSGAGLVAVALAHGIALAVLVSITAQISGGHVNPAVTISLWVTGKVESTRAMCYIAAQMAGAVFGALALSLVVPKTLWEEAMLGTPQLNRVLGVGAMQGVATEAILTFFLVFAVFGTAVDPRGAFSKLAGFSIGLVLTFDILMGGPMTGAAMNPARWFGPAIVSGTWSDWWIYLIGPVAGGVAAALVYWAAFLRRKEDELALLERAG
ncbi:MAG: MIP/aquaporin family protein [Actinomycetota bacterium]